MTDAFEAWINSFTDEEYEEMLDESNPSGFTDRQQEKALNIRSAPTKEELEDLELEQEFIEEPEPEERPRGRITEVSIPTPTEAPVIDVSGSTAQVIPTPIPRTPPAPRLTPPKPRAIVQAVKQAVRSGISFARRIFRI